MSQPLYHKKNGEPIDSKWELDIPVPDHVLPISQDQNVPWEQWMMEIEPWIVRFRDKPPHFMDPRMERFVLD